ncbi:site-specific integrase [Erythrobacter sp. G21629-S1]|nr:site-specific integrase [Erythrobacter sp. G21629-S1]
MASISKRGSSWFVQIRRKGFRPRFRSFASRSEAQQWARLEESAMDNGLGRVEASGKSDPTIAELLRKYSDEVASQNKGAQTEQLRLAKMSDAPFASLTASNLTCASIADYRDERLRSVKPATVRRELGMLRRVIEVARKDWSAPIRENPVAQISFPPAKDARDRRLRGDELERLLSAIDLGRNPLIRPVILFALETGLRRGEMLRLQWRDIDIEARSALIRNTKNGSDRTIPLSKPAVAILNGLEMSSCGPFPLSGNALRQCWTRACERAAIKDLRFHDLRHEAISRLFELGLTVPEVALISGHRDARMLFRYTHLAPMAVRERLDRLAQNLINAR